MSFRIGKFAVVIDHYAAGCGWSLHKWRWRGESSWKHGAAYLGRFRIVW